MRQAAPDAAFPEIPAGFARHSPIVQDRNRDGLPEEGRVSRPFQKVRPRWRRSTNSRTPISTSPLGSMAKFALDRRRDVLARQQSRADASRPVHGAAAQARQAGGVLNRLDGRARPFSRNPEEMRGQRTSTDEVLDERRRLCRSRTLILEKDAVRRGSLPASLGIAAKRSGTGRQR